MGGSFFVGGVLKVVIVVCEVVGVHIKQFCLFSEISPLAESELRGRPAVDPWLPAIMPAVENRGLRHLLTMPHVPTFDQQ